MGTEYGQTGLVPELDYSLCCRCTVVEHSMIWKGATKEIVQIGMDGLVSEVGVCVGKGAIK